MPDNITMTSSISEVTVESVEKRTSLKKHYVVYVLTVVRRDQTATVIYRRCRDFHKLHSRLVDLLKSSPAESTISLPLFPGTMFFGRTFRGSAKKVAVKQQIKLDEYCKALLSLPALISESEVLQEFFSPTSRDIAEIQKSCGLAQCDDISSPITTKLFVAITDYRTDSPGQAQLSRGEEVEVVDQNEAGWWMVSTHHGLGWVPAAYLDPKDAEQVHNVITFARGMEENYIVSVGYEKVEEDELTVRPGDVVLITEKNLEGWWMASCGGQMGRVPVTNIAKADTMKAQRAFDRAAMMGQNVCVPSDYVGELADYESSGCTDIDEEDSTSNRAMISECGAMSLTERTLSAQICLPPPRRATILKKEKRAIINGYSLHVSGKTTTKNLDHIYKNTTVTYSCEEQKVTILPNSDVENDQCTNTYNENDNFQK